MKRIIGAPLFFLLITVLVSISCSKSTRSNDIIGYLLGFGRTLPPRVVSTMPADSAMGISITPTIVATFSKAMDASSITSSTFTITGGSSGSITATASYDADTKTAVLNLVSPASLQYLTQYTVTITDNVRDSMGNPLASDIQWAFTTISEGTVPAPSVLPLPGTKDSAVNVAITCTDGTADIRYTTDGITQPTSTVGMEYTGEILISENTLLRAVAYRAGWNDSAVTEGQYNIRTAEPSFNIGGNEYNSDQYVELTSPGATIYYTMTSGTVSFPPADPVDPTISSAMYNNVIPVEGHDTIVKIKAMALAPHMSPSNVMLETYTVVYDQVADPQITPVTGDDIYFTGTVNITIDSTTDGDTIYYTTDGVTEPSRDIGELYNGSFDISENTTIKAIAFKDGMLDSNVTTSEYKIRVAKPEFTPDPGTQSGNVDVVITSAGDHIYYETTTGTVASPPADPDDPTTFSSEYVSTPILVHDNNTIVKIKAIAVKDGLTTSEIQYGEYIININHDPTAVVESNQTAGVIPATITFYGVHSSDPDKDGLSCSWDFGDGTTGTGSTVQHEFTTSGDKTVVLTVDDGRGGSDTASVVVNLVDWSGLNPHGPYSITTGDDLELIGSGDPGVTFIGWDLNNAAPDEVSESCGYITWYEINSLGLPRNVPCTIYLKGLDSGSNPISAPTSLVIYDKWGVACYQFEPNRNPYDATVYVNETIYLDASCSFHPDPRRTVIWYDWVWNYTGDIAGDPALLIPDISIAEPTTTHVYTSTGTYRLALRIRYDNDSYGYIYERSFTVINP